ncbi:MAG: DUF4091 domain-containing protein [Theionarchaea archaeon]|nr:DUF4091 domain-containing protein [Theionarchaea archaeon]
MLKKVVFVVCVCMLFYSGTSKIEVGITHGLERIRMHDPVPEDREVYIRLAKNEYEPFQIVMKSGENVEGVVYVTDLYDEKGNVFSREHFTFYEVHYLYVRELSPRSKGEPGWHPDGLKPFEEVTIAKGENTVVWVDVYAPVDQIPGVYTGSIYIDVGDVIEVPVTVEVWNFTLPEKVSLKSGIEVMVEYVLEAHGLSWDPEELEPYLYDYYETLIEHRLMPWELYFAEPEVFKDGSIDMEENHEHLKYFMDTLQVNCLAYPLYEDWPFRDPFGRDLEKTTRYLRNLYEYYAENGWENRFFFYLIDEPNSKRAYQEVRDISRKLEEIHPDIRFLVTEQMVPDDPSWGDLIGYVDIWCPLFPCIEEEKALIKERQALGEEVWTYTALTQGEQETPFWELDFPVLNYRVVTWMIWNSEISGLVYWTCNWWDVKDPWEDTGTWTEDGEVYNGEGVLMYPGKDGCLPSIRLKVLREGMEDYEYFVILESLGKESFADKEVKKIVKSWYEWDENPEQLLDVRRILGEEINRITAGSDGSQEVPQEEREGKEEIKEEQEKEYSVEKEEKEEIDKNTEEVEDLPESEQDSMWVRAPVVLVGLLAVLLLILAVHVKKKEQMEKNT